MLETLVEAEQPFQVWLDHKKEEVWRHVTMSMFGKCLGGCMDQENTQL